METEIPCWLSARRPAKKSIQTEVSTPPLTGHLHIDIQVNLAAQGGRPFPGARPANVAQTFDESLGDALNIRDVLRPPVNAMMNSYGPRLAVLLPRLPRALRNY